MVDGGNVFTHINHFDGVSPLISKQHKNIFHTNGVDARSERLKTMR